MAERDEIIDDEIIDEETREEEVDEDESVDDDLGIDDDNLDDESENDSNEESDDDDIVVTFGDEEVPATEVKKTPKWVKELRKQNRDLKKQIKELERHPASATEKKPVVLGEKPTLAGCDYDSVAYEKQLTEWYERKREADAQAASAEAEKEAQQKDYQAKVERYNKSKASLKVRDFEESESVITDNLNEIQQNIILYGSENPALVVYALGKNDKRAKELATIKDPIQFAFAIAKMEAQLKVTKRNDIPAPERKLKSGSSAGAVDSTLERLREEAAKTGDFTKVRQYKQKLKTKR